MTEAEFIMLRWAKMCSEGHRSRAISEVYMILDIALDANDIEKVRQFCKAACSVPDKTESVCISILTVGHWRYDDLKNELKPLYEAVHSAISQKYDAQYATNSLVGLEVE